MGLDVENVGLGLLAGWGSAYLVYRSRHGIRRVIDAARGGAAQATEAATQSADRRYISDLIARADASGILGPRLPLTSLLIEPRFIPLRPVDTAFAAGEALDLYAGIPLTHDLPALYAPYNLDSVTLDELSTGSPALALLGRPGSGRTTALWAIVLHALGRLEFTHAPDNVQARLDREEAALSEKERAVRVKERIMTEQRAKERLASERAELAPQEIDQAAAATGLRFHQRVPVYVHLAELLAYSSDFAGGADPAEPLVRAVQASVGRVTASIIPREMYTWLSRGLVLALVDGFDELAESDQTRALNWLTAFRKHYSGSFLIVTGGVSGSGGLLDLGLTPVYLRPWQDVDVNSAVERLAAAPPADRKAKAEPPPGDAALALARANTRALTAAEITLKVAANLHSKVEMAGPEGWLRAALGPLLPPGQNAADWYPRLARLAALELDESVITPERMQALEIAGQAAAVSDEAPAATEGRGKGKAAPKPASDQSRLLGALERTGLLLPRGGERYQFRHPLFTAYLASQWLKTAEPAARLDRLMRPTWAGAFAHLALHTPVDDLVRQRMSQPGDVLHNHAFELARWVANAPADAAWRGPVLRGFGLWFNASAQYPLVRERAAAALITTRDPSVLVIFRQGARSANPLVRRLACVAMGALGSPDAVRDLTSLMQDRDHSVALAAAMALGAIGGEDALQALLVSFTQGSERIRQAIAEALSSMPDDGYPILFEAINDDDMLLRRAAVFGLRRIRTPWAIIAIYRAFLEDSQWYVRSAAQQAFEEIQYGRRSSPTEPIPQAAALDWLTLWAAHRGETVPAGPAGDQVLVRVLQEGNGEERALAAATLGHLGVTSSLRPLYGALRDRHDDVRAAAFQALGALQQRMAVPLPAPA